MLNPRDPATRILLRGNFREANFGDDALLLASAALLTGSDRQILVDSPGAVYSDRRMGGLRNRIPEDPFPDLICYGGGTQFFSFGRPVTGATAQTLLRRILGKVAAPRSIFAGLHARRVASRDRRIPTIAIGIGIGPFQEDTEAEASVARLLRRMRLVWVRDRPSELFCKAHGIERVVSSTDLCFTEAFAQITGPVATIGNGTASRADTLRRRVGFILRDWHSLEPDFFRRQVEVARRLRQMGHEVRFLCLTSRDHCCLAELAEANETVATWQENTGPIEVFWRLINEQDLIVTSRFHGAIFALLSRKPFVAIEIEQKLVNLREIVPGLERFAIDHRATADEVEARILDVLAHGDDLEMNLTDAIATQRARAFTGVAALNRVLENG